MSIRMLVWRENGQRSLVTLTPGEAPAVAEEPVPDGFAELPGPAGIAVLEAPDGWLAEGAHPLGTALYAGPDADTLLTDFVAEGHVDEHAPTQAEGEILIEADPDRVWEVLADVGNWPSIRGDVRDVVSDGPAQPGGTFTWSTGPNRISSVFGAAEPGRLLTWVSRAAGIVIAHVYRMEPASTGRTRLSCKESAAGPVVTALFTSAVVQHGVDTWLQGVKTLAEAR